MKNYDSEDTKEFYQFLDNLIRPREVINKKIPEIIEAFVDYYGEEMREKITDKFNNAIILFHIMPTQIKKCCQKVSDGFKMHIYQKISNLLGLEFRLDSLFIDKLDNVYLSYLEKDNKQMIQDIIDLYDMQEYDISEIKEKISQINPLLNDIDDFENHVQKYIEIMSIPIDQINESYDDNILDDLAGILDIERKTYKIYFYLALIKQKDTFPKPIKDSLNKVKTLMDKYDSIYSSDFHYQLNLLEQKDLKIIEKIFGDLSGENDGLIESFSSIATELLKDENTAKWIKKQIMQNRQEYLKTLNINIDEIDLQTLKNILPKEEDVDNLLDLKDTALLLAVKEIYNSMELHVKNLRDLKAQFPVYDEDYYALDGLNSTYLGWQITSVFKADDGLKEKGLIMIYQGKSIKHLDGTIIHELNHWLETTVYQYKEEDEIFNGYCGFDEMIGHIYKGEEEKPKLKHKEISYEKFNEIINEKITQEIVRKMHNNGIYIFNFPNYSNIKGSSDYEFYNFLIDEFYHEFKDIIIKSRQTGGVEKLKQEIDGESIEQLNEIINQCSDNIDTLIDSDVTDYNQLANLLTEYKNISNLLFQQIKNKQTSKHKVKKLNNFN